jgi:tRNA modification GTPase
MIRSQFLKTTGPRMVSAFVISLGESKNVHVHGRRQVYFSTFSPQEQEQEDDTIFALSTGAPVAGSATAVAVIRITGPESHSILSNLSKGKPLPPPRMAAVRNLYDEDDNPLDQALVLRFDKPNSFTGEHVVELHCHGSRAVVQGILTTLAKARGCQHQARLAERGEFTQRAFGNGKLNLLQVEALADLLTSDTQMQRQQALRQLDGTLQNLYQDWRSRLTKGLAHAEAVIDFGDDEQLDEHENEEEDEDASTTTGQENIWGNVGYTMASLRRDMQQFLSDKRRGELVREGVKIAIVGPPNAGKSSLFNLLAKREAAIVSPIAGTTRDVLELTLDLGGVRCTLSDTAGVHENSNDIIEQEGMKRARNVAKQADIIVVMADVMDADPQKKLMSVLENVLEMMKEAADEEDALDSKNVLLALNKVDLSSSSDNSEEDPQFVLPKEMTAKLGGTFFMSCETNHGINVFLEALTTTVLARVQTTDNNNNDDDDSALQTGGEGAIITRARHRQHVEAAVEALIRFETRAQQGTIAVDMAAEELRLATSELGRITGAVDVEDVLNVLFTDFCIGK